jgi:uncharacterized Zn-binding protein involved in type VI secretion
MPQVARLADKAQTSADAHGCPACPHPAIGPIVQGSTDVFVNGRPAARKGDKGVHAVCCGPNTFTIAKGSPDVYVNGQPLARMNDKTQHCGGTGPITEGSPDVYANEGSGAAALGKFARIVWQIVQGQTKTVKVAQRQAGSDTQFQWAKDISSPAAQTGPAQQASATIEVQVIDASGAALAGFAYELTLPDGTVQRGHTDNQGKISVNAGSQQGQCTLVLPGL